MYIWLNFTLFAQKKWRQKPGLWKNWPISGMRIQCSAILSHTSVLVQKIHPRHSFFHFLRDFHVKDPSAPFRPWCPLEFLLVGLNCKILQNQFWEISLPYISYFFLPESWIVGKYFVLKIGKHTNKVVFVDNIFTPFFLFFCRKFDHHFQLNHPEATSKYLIFRHVFFSRSWVYLNISIKTPRVATLYDNAIVIMVSKKCILFKNYFYIRYLSEPNNTQSIRGKIRLTGGFTCEKQLQNLNPVTIYMGNGALTTNSVEQHIWWGHLNYFIFNDYSANLI